MDVSDVAIVGGGPSGAWTACLLARTGVPVTIFDASHPREKACGGGVTGRAIDLVRTAIPADPAGSGRLRLPGVPIERARFLDSDRGAESVVPLAPADGHETLTVVSRRAFDAALLAAAERAGARLVRETVRAIERPDGESAPVTLRTDRGRYRARVVVGADGANSLVRRTFAAPFPRAHLSIATGFYAHGVTASDIALEFVSGPAGYIWSFPRADHLAIGICAQADAGATAGDLRERTRLWIQRTGIGASATLAPYSWPIPSLPASAWPTAPLGGPGWLLVGDAAGLVDPITREGIFFALQSAGIAAIALVRSPQAAHVDYAAEVRLAIVPELRRAAQLKAGFFRPQFARLVIDALQSSERIRGVMADLVAGTQPYSTLKGRLLRTLEVGLAWRMLTAHWRDSRHAPALAPAGD